MSEKPLAYVVLCCTAVPAHQRGAITRQAHDMGALLQPALTSDVTHLVVGSSQSEKYRFAARCRPDIKFMDASWVAQLHDRWISGQDVDVVRLERLHKHPLLQGLRISVTNLDVEARTQVEQLVLQHGGKYTGDLTKENTHLIAGSASGRKCDAVRAWNNGCKVVGIEWLYASIKRDAALGEEYFNLDIPSKERGKDAWQPALRNTASTEADETTTTGTKRKADASQPAVTLKRKLSRRASQHPVAGDGLWDQIFVNRETEEGLQAGAQDVTFDLPDTSRSFMQDDADLELHEKAATPVFRGCQFCVQGFNAKQTELVKAAVENEAGQVVESEQEGCYMVVPQGTVSPPCQSSTTVVTEWWIERSLHLRRLVPPADAFGGRPFSGTFPVDKMNEMSICISGFEGIDLLHIEKLIKLTGARFAEGLSRDCSLLVANSPSSRRCTTAQKLGVRIVSQSWLEEVARTGRSVKVGVFALDGLADAPCRIDGLVLRQRKRAQVLRSCVLFICPGCKDASQLHGMATALGAEMTQLANDRVTHLIGELDQIAHQEALVDEGAAFVVTPAWLRACDAASAKQAEQQFLPVLDKPEVAVGKAAGIAADIKPKPTKAANAKSAPATRTESTTAAAQIALKLTAKMVPANAGKRSRRLLGRAASAPDAMSEDGGATSDGSMTAAGGKENRAAAVRVGSLPTAVRQEAFAFDTAEPRLVVPEEEEGAVRYADPETAAVRRSILARLEGRGNEVAGEPLIRTVSSLSTDLGGSLKGGASVSSLLKEDESSAATGAASGRASSSGSGMTKAVGLGSRKTRTRTAAAAATLVGR